MSTLAPAQPTPTAALSAADRCDRCSAAAMVAVDLHSGGTLLFCGHHYSKHEQALQAGQLIAAVRDERFRLS